MGGRAQGCKALAGLWAAVAALCLGLGPGQGTAQDRSLTLAADARLDATGFLAYLTPRFSLKAGIRVTRLPADPGELDRIAAEGGAGALIAAEPQARALRDAGLGDGLHVAFHSEGAGAEVAYAILVLDGAPEAAAFAEWLASEIGQRTVAGFPGAGGLVYVPGAAEAKAEEVALPEGDARLGEELALRHCGRCHVVSEQNRFGGIGSTPSFAALRSMADWQQKFQNFWAANPHPVFTRIEGLTAPFDPNRPPHIAPVVIDVDDLAALVAYAASIAPKDLGAALRSR